MNWSATGAFLLALGVVLGAFGAHQLRDRLDPYSMGLWEKAVFYHFIHALGLLVVALLPRTGTFSQPAAARVCLLLVVGIADVDSLVAKSTPIDTHAGRETTTVYAGIRTFPMLPERLSTDLTSLSENQDRDAIVIEMVVAQNGDIASSSVFRARVRNRAQLTYSGVGPWLEGKGAPPAKIAASAEL